ncbi:YdcF family protein [Pseudomonas sp. BLCC-B13]|uniref:YdcF family protein n=1 Tax=Pseudomonas sp. BLCC-B13 TaxID=3025314 RepID=UPI00234F5507|nr:YdcF family protein [Pseudomonas sp. BLCC-B13]MDC7825161.1 YdcF family protein [Pseudomonas sp. BLCC-B13]
MLAGVTVAALQIAAYAPAPSPARGDAAIVLGAAVWQEQPSPVFAERLNHAIRLMQQQRVDYLILTGGRGEGDTQAEAEVARRYALQAGVPGERILTESVSTITAENLSEACGLMRRHGLQSAFIVSDPLHMQRAMLLARDIGIRAHAAPTPTSRYRSWKSKGPSLAYETFFYLSYLATRSLGLKPQCAAG